MTANVETMFSVREVPWHGIGTIVEDAPTAADAIKLAGLDWQVKKRPIFCDGIPVLGRVGNVRELPATLFEPARRDLLGIVSANYKIVQNAEAFDFFDSLIGTEARYETAGSLGGGRQIFLTARVEKGWTIADDDIDAYLLLSNGHDGQHPLKAAITPVRVVCQNTLTFALETARRVWTLYHRQNIEDKLADARRALNLTAQYMDQMVSFGNRAADQKISPATIEALADELLKPEEETEQSAKTLERRKSLFEKCYDAADLKPYRGTAWGILNAVSDYETHVYGTATGRMKRTLNDQLQLLNRAAAFLAQGV